MPFKARKPAGGFRVMYEYANRLSQLGYSVHITYPLSTKYMKYRFPYWIRLILSKIEGLRTCQWFNFDKKITMSYVKSIREDSVIDADIIIVTWWTTVCEVSKLSVRKGKKINLIQGYEDWEGYVDELHSSYDLKNIHNVVISHFLQKIVSRYTKKEITYIPNGINTDIFKIKNPIKTRNPLNICMLYSIQEIKGTKYGMEALFKLHSLYPDMRIDLFGICPQPKDLPNWIRYHYNLNDLSSIFNDNVIFISNSLTEGFGLVSVEAMACGCALVCTNIEGHKEFAIDHDTALLVEPKNPDDVVMKVSSLIDNQQKLFDISERASLFVQKYSWNSSVEKMNRLIQDLLYNSNKG